MNAAAISPDSEPSQLPKSGIYTWLARAQALTFSTLIHAVIIIILGGTVMLKVQEEAPDFVAEGGGLVSPDDVKVATPQEKPQLEPTEFKPTSDAAATSAAAPTLMAAITTSAASTSSLSASATLTPTINIKTEMKPMTATVPAAKGTLSKEMAGKIAGFTSGWAVGGRSSMGKPLKSREFAFTAYLARYQGGDWDSTVWFRDNKPEISGGSLPNLLYLVGRLSKGKIRADPQAIPLDLASDDIFVKKPPFIWFTGHRDFKLSDKEVENLADYLRHGGCLWGDSSVPGQRSRFDIAFRREMLRLVPPGEQWYALPSNHPIYASNYFTEVRGVAAGVNFYDEPVYALNGYGGSIAILYTANDYGDMWQFGLDDNYEFDTTRDEKRRMVAINEEMWHRRGLYFRNIEPKSLQESYKFGTNIIVYLLTRWEDKVRNAPLAL
ncbi:MAG: DUF4159 domain-containing protein [Chthoniobacteraceae bacterium]